MKIFSYKQLVFKNNHWDYSILETNMNQNICQFIERTLEFRRSLFKRYKNNKFNIKR